ncbi:MAG: prepilin peptidase [Anaerovoracaceae bacterium]|jgi:leader peptidase (prepilin peptidase)/N-methyltransferase
MESKRHFLIYTGLFAASAAVSFAAFGVCAGAAVSCAAVCALAYAAVRDMETMEIPDRVHVILLALGAVQMMLPEGVSVLSRVAGMLAVSLPMLIFDCAAFEAFGGGDIKLCAACGFFLGINALLTGFFISVAAAGMFAAVMLAAGKMERRQYFAFGPFIAGGMSAAVFAGDMIREGCAGIFFA